jgi:Cu+-exporting ATPase
VAASVTTFLLAGRLYEAHARRTAGQAMRELAGLGFLNPLVAAATMTLSSVFVVWNSLRLRRFSVPGSPLSAG